MMDQLQLNPDVKAAIIDSFVEDSDHVQQLLSILAKPPLYSTLRINLQKIGMLEAVDALKQFFAEECRLRSIAEFSMYPHSELSDCLIIENRGPVSLNQAEKEIVVDISCGMAVLRGANVFAQGILGCPQNLKTGDNVSVVSDLDGKCLKGFAGIYNGNKLHVGNGIAQLSRSDLFNAKTCVSGVGILMTQPVYEAPSLNNLPFPWIFPQNLPSMVGAWLLNPQPGQRILDMCAAPGGKTSHIAALIGNSGEVIALEKSCERTKKMSALMERLGHTNVKCYQFNSIKAMSDCPGTDGSPPYLPSSFDCILVDAPCSALGQRPSVINKITLNQLRSFPVIQHKLLLTAAQLLKEGGTLVYSTCTVTVEENEDQVARLLAKCPYLELIEPVYKFGGPGLPGTQLKPELLSRVQRFDPSILLTQTSIKESYNIDTIGFFIAVFQKKSS